MCTNLCDWTATTNVIFLNFNAWSECKNVLVTFWSTFASKIPSNLITAEVTAPNFSEWLAASLGKTDENTSFIMRRGGRSGSEYSEENEMEHEQYERLKMKYLRKMHNWDLLIWWLLCARDKVILCFYCDVKCFCRFPVTVQRKAHKSWASIKGGQIHSTIGTIHPFFWAALVASCAPDGNPRRLSEHQGTSIKRMRSGETERREQNQPCSHLTTCYRSATAAGLELLDERGGRGGTAAQNLFRSINAMFIFEVLAWCAPLLVLTKWWVCEAGRNGDRLGWAFLAQRM